jgi:hypothetical protein
VAATDEAPARAFALTFALDKMNDEGGRRRNADKNPPRFVLGKPGVTP